MWILKIWFCVLFWLSFLDNQTETKSDNFIFWNSWFCISSIHVVSNYNTFVMRCGTVRNYVWIWVVKMNDELRLLVMKVNYLACQGWMPLARRSLLAMRIVIQYVLRHATLLVKFSYIINKKKKIWMRNYDDTMLYLKCFPHSKLTNDNWKRIVGKIRSLSRL